MLRRTLDIIGIVRSQIFSDHSLVLLKFQAGQAGGGESQPPAASATRRIHSTEIFS